MPEYMTGKVVDSEGRLRNAAGASTLWEHLEPTAPARFSLSAKACEGIIRRAEQHGKHLPSILMMALRATIERERVTCLGSVRQPAPIEDGLAGTLDAGHEQPIVVIDRASFNQGKNAQYPPHIEETDLMDTLVARGPHALCYRTGMK